MYIDDLTGLNQDRNAPATIDINDRASIGNTTLFLSLIEVHGEIRFGPHIVEIENRIE